jgi:predicted PurR-regulated permease PerM
MVARNPLTQLTAVTTATFVLFCLYFGRDIVLPCALAILLSFLLTPLVRRLERRDIARLPAVLIVVFLTCCLTASIGYLVINQAAQFSTELPRYKNNLLTKVRDLRGATHGKFERASETISELAQELTDSEQQKTSLAPPPSDPTEQIEDNGTFYTSLAEFLLRSTNNSPRGDPSDANDSAVAVRVVELPPSPLSQISSWLGPLVTPLTTSGIVFVLTIFFLLQREDLRNRILQLVGTSHIRITTELLDDATQRISRLLRMQLIVNASYGLCVAIGLYLIGLPNAIMWGILGLVLRFLPYLGPWLVASLPTVVALAISDNWTPVIFTILWFITLELIVNNVLEPWLYGASTGVSSVGIILAAIFWTFLWGPIGLVLAMPLSVCLVTAGKYIKPLHFLNVLFASDASLSFQERFYQRLLALDDDECQQIISNYLKANSIEKLYDEVLVPAMQLAERDRHAGLLSEAQEEMIHDTLMEILEETATTISHRDSDSAAIARTKPVALCVPARDAADEIGARMLSQTLRGAAIENEVRSKAMLASELVAQIHELKTPVVAISNIPPGGTRHARYLCKRLRAEFPELMIVVGVWGDGDLDLLRHRFVEAGATHVLRSLREAAKIIKAVPAARPPEPGKFAVERVDDATHVAPHDTTQHEQPSVDSR